MGKEVKKGAENAPKVNEAENKNVEAVETTEVKSDVATKSKAKSGFTVKKAFKDAPQYRNGGKAKQHAVGDDVSGFDVERLEDLVKRGYVEKAG